MSREQIQAIIDNGGMCKTRCGDDVELFAIRGDKAIGTYADTGGVVYASDWSLDGKWFKRRPGPHHLDLILPPEVQYVRWVVQGGEPLHCKSCESATRVARRDHYPAVHKITYYKNGSTPTVETVWRRENSSEP